MSVDTKKISIELVDLLRGARLKDPNALKKLGNYSFNGKAPFGLNYTAAAGYYEQVPSPNLTYLENENLAKIYYTGNGKAKDIAKAVSIFKRIPIRERKDEVLKAVAVYEYSKKNYDEVIANLEALRNKNELLVKYYLEEAYFAKNQYAKHLKLVETFNNEYLDERQAVRYVRSVFAEVARFNVKKLEWLRSSAFVKEENLLSALKICYILSRKKDLPLSLRDEVLSLLIKFYSGDVIAECYNHSILLKLAAIKGTNVNAELKSSFSSFSSAFSLVLLYPIITSSRLSTLPNWVGVLIFLIILILGALLIYKEVDVCKRGLAKSNPRRIFICILATFLVGMLGSDVYKYFMYIPNLFLVAWFSLYAKDKKSVWGNIFD